MIAYKLMRKMKDGYAPLFIDSTMRLEVGKWYECRTDIIKKGFAQRPGWHCCFTPNALHLAENPKNGAPRVWLECEIDGWVNEYDRPSSQGGKWMTAQHLKIIREI